MPASTFGEEEQALARLKQQFSAVSLRPSDATPNPIFHYTSAAGLIAIIASGVFRATNFNYLNDTSEIHHGYAVASQVIAEKELGRSLSGSQKRMLAVTRQTLETVVLSQHFYLACFCSKGDILSQWRGYGSIRDRFSIGIDTERLPERGLPYRFRKVLYRRSDQRARVTKSLNDALAVLKRDDDNIDFAAQVGRVLADQLVAELVFFKDWAFRDEREWRAVTIGNPTAKQVSFDGAAGIVRPFVNLWKGTPHPSRPKLRLLPITGITAFSKRSKLAVELLLAKHGYKDVTVSTSTVPYQEL